jgi:hypothetical protein
LFRFVIRATRYTAFAVGLTIANGYVAQSYTGSSIAPELGLALNRVGHHIREAIVEEARASLGDTGDVSQRKNPDIPEPIPEDQEEINKQADAAIRDLFPRIPNTDRQTIIERSFKKVSALPQDCPHKVEDELNSGLCVILRVLRCPMARH